MKKNLSLLLLAIFIFPSVAFASWWNPLSWSIFNWNKYDKQVLEEKIKELETQVSRLSTTTNISGSKNNPVISNVSVDNDRKAVFNNSIQDPYLFNTVQSSEGIQSSRPSDFRVKCEPSRSEVEVGKNVRATILLPFEKMSEFDIVWTSKSLTKILDKNEAMFLLDSVKDVVTATVTRKSDGYSKNVQCNVRVNDIKEENFDRKDSEECASATALLNSINTELKPIEDKLNKYYKEYLATGKHSNTKEESELTSQRTDLEIRKLGIQSDYNYECLGYVAPIPKTYSTECYYVGSILRCSTQ